MNAASSKHIMIIGSGFGGSILAAILAKAGIRVMLVDHQSHPRFAIGESSTPTATFILKSLVKHYQLTELEAENVEIRDDAQVQQLAKLKRTFQVLLADDTLNN